MPLSCSNRPAGVRPVRAFHARLFIALLLCPIVPVLAGSASTTGTPRFPLTQNGGTWPSGHVQGIAVDPRGGYIYYSFTDLLARYDFSGRLVGTLVGWTGHLGDLDFNPADGKVYGSLEYKADEAFYIAIIDVDRIDRVGIDARAADVLRTVHVAEVARDYAADMDGDGRFDGDVADTRDHRYGCSGIDGVGFGPAFGHPDGPVLLTVAYGIYGNLERTDNDHQVLLQYDVGGWNRLARPLSETAPHRSGPEAPQGKYFVRTGNTTYGVQNLAYDPHLRRWFLGVYPGRKASFPNYRLFAIDADTPPMVGELVGVRNDDGDGWARGPLLALAEDGLEDTATGLRGWQQKADVGLQPLGDGLYYLARNAGDKHAQTADLTLMRWTGDTPAPFAPVAPEELP